MSSKLTLGDLQVINRFPVFRGLKPETIEHIVAPATAIALKAHTYLCRQGDPATAFFILIDGWVKVFRVTISGDEAIIRMLTKGDSFAEAAAFTGTQFLASAVATSDARIVRIPIDHVVRCIQKSPDIALAMIASTSHHVQHLVEQVEQLKVHSGVQRVAEFLVSLSSTLRGPSDIALPYDKVLIAGRLGLRPESLSRAFGKLKSLGVAVHTSHVAIDDVAMLRRLVSDERGASRGPLRVGRSA